MFFGAQFARKRGHYGPRPKGKKLFCGRNNKSRSSAFRNFLCYQHICFDWVMNLFLSWVMFSVKKKCHFQLKQLLHPYSYFHWCGYLFLRLFVTTDEFSVRVTKIILKDWFVMNSQSTFLLLAYLAQYIMAIIKKM